MEYFKNNKTTVTTSVVADYFSTDDASPAASGVLRLGNNETIAWRNAADSADATLKYNTSDEFEFSSDVFITGNLTTSGFVRCEGVYSDDAGTIASTGFIRLANGLGSKIAWRNAADSGDKYIAVNTSDELEIDTDMTVTGDIFSTGTVEAVRVVANTTANINFGTATDSNVCELPYGTTTELNAVTQTAGLLAYNTTLGKLVINNGTSFETVTSS